MAAYRVIPPGDIDVDENGRFVMVDGPTYLRQKLAARFKFFLGEWFLNQEEGIPYFRVLFVKNPNLDVVRALLRKVLLSCSDVAAINRFALSFDRAARTLAFDFEVKSASGTTVTVAPTDELFVITV